MKNTCGINGISVSSERKKAQKKKKKKKQAGDDRSSLQVEADLLSSVCHVLNGSCSAVTSQTSVSFSYGSAKIIHMKHKQDAGEP